MHPSAEVILTRRIAFDWRREYGNQLQVFLSKTNAGEGFRGNDNNNRALIALVAQLQTILDKLGDFVLWEKTLAELQSTLYNECSVSSRIRIQPGILKPVF